MRNPAANVTRLLMLTATIALVAMPAVAGSDAWWNATDDPTVSALGDLTEAEAVTFDHTGAFAAAAFPDPKRAKRSFVRMTVRGETRAVDDVSMPARVRALLYVSGVDTLYVIVQRSGKSRPLETYIVSMDVDELGASRGINLPHTSWAMDIWAREGSLVVSSTDEIRTFQLPDFRSGPLYRMPGQNLAILNLPGTNRFLIGRNEGVVMVDFDDTPGREGLPVRERVATNSAVMELAPLADGRVSILLADGNSRTLWTDPLRATEEKPEPPPPPPAPMTPPVTPPVEQVVAATPAAVPTEEPAAEPAPVEETPEEPAPNETPADANVYGRLSGDARGDVRWVVLQGPNNLLNEAARVEPGDDGAWSCGNLAPGTYRVVLDAGGSRVVHSTPSFRVVRIEPDGEPIEVEPFEVLRVR